MFLSYILQPTRVTYHSTTLTGNIFSNISKEATCGNLTSTMLDHLLKFLNVLCLFSNQPISKSNIFERNWNKSSKEEFIIDYSDTDWDALNLGGNDRNIFFSFWCMCFQQLLDTHAPYKNISKYKLEFKAKLWITTSLQKSIYVKNTLFKKYITLKDPIKRMKPIHNINVTKNFFQLY